MISGTENSVQTLDNSSDTVELRREQEPEMDSVQNEFSIKGATHRSMNEQMKLATKPILRQVENLCVVLASRNEL